MKNEIFFDDSHSLLSDRCDLMNSFPRSIELLRRPTSFNRPSGVWLRDGGGDCRRASARSRFVIPLIWLSFRIPSRVAVVARVEEMAWEKVRRRPTVCPASASRQNSTCGEKAMSWDPEKVMMTSSMSKSTP